MKRRVDDVVRSLIRPAAGGNETPEERSIIILSLEKFAASQRHQSIIFAVIVAILLVAPVVLLFSSVPKDNLALLLGGTGLFTAGTLKYLVAAMTDMSRAHALIIICRGLESVDAREVLSIWLGRRK